MPVLGKKCDTPWPANVAQSRYGSNHLARRAGVELLRNTWLLSPQLASAWRDRALKVTVNWKTLECTPPTQRLVCATISINCDLDGLLYQWFRGATFSEPNLRAQAKGDEN